MVHNGSFHMLMFIKKESCKITRIHSKDVNVYYVKLFPNALRELGSWSDKTKLSYLSVAQRQKGIEILTISLV